MIFWKKKSFIMTKLTLCYGNGYSFTIWKKAHPLWPNFGNKCCVSFTLRILLMCEEFTCFALLRVGSFRILQMLFIQFEANKWTCLWLINIFWSHTKVHKPKFTNHTHVRNVISSVGQFIDFVITFDSRFPKDFKINNPWFQLFLQKS
jgi:hypothetical protein